MTVYDAVMLGVVVAGMAWGAWKGITWQVASIASLVLGYLFSHPLSAQLAPHFPGEPAIARAEAMLAVYVLVSGGVFFVAWLIRATLRQLKFEAFDRHLGMVLGGMEGAMLGIVGTLFVTSLAPSTRGPIFASPSGRVVGQVMDAVGPVLPSQIRAAFAPHWGHNAAAPVASADDDTTAPAPADPAPAEPRSGRIGRPSFVIGSIDRASKDKAGVANPDDEPAAEAPRPRSRRRPGESPDTANADAPAPAAEELPSAGEVGQRLGRVAGQVLEQQLGDQVPDLDPKTRAKLGKVAGDLLEKGVREGDVPEVKALYKKGKSRLGRIAGEVLEREFNRLGETDGPSTDAPRR